MFSISVEASKWNLRESFTLGMTFGCQQTVDGFKVTSLDEVTRGVCKREENIHSYVPGMSLEDSGNSTGAKESTCCHTVAPLSLWCHCCWLDMGWMPASTWLITFSPRNLNWSIMKHKQHNSRNGVAKCLWEEKAIPSGEREINEGNIKENQRMMPLDLRQLFWSFLGSDYTCCL